MLKKSVVLKQIREQCERGVRYTHALRNIIIGGTRRKVSPATLKYWRVRPMIDSYIDYCVNIRDEKITDKIEDKLNDRILQGEASPAEIIFYLCNRRVNRWKRHDTLVDHSTHYHFTTIKEAIENASNNGAKARDRVLENIESPRKLAE